MMDAAENGNEDALYVSELIWEPESIIEEDWKIYKTNHNL